MKSRVLHEAASALGRRESALRARFLDPVAHVTTWTPLGIDYAAGYVGLLHSEAEFTLERVVRLLLQNAKNKSQHYAPDAVLLNACMYYRDRMQRALGSVDLIPKRDKLKTDPLKLLNVWEDLGGDRFFNEMLKGNHGAGMRYVEGLFHPLGVVVTEKAFKRLSSTGVQEVCALGPTTTTMLTEFVSLRGSAMHAGTKAFADSIFSSSPQDIAQRGGGVVSFIDEVAKVLARAAW